MVMQEMNVTELAQCITDGVAPIILDVREPNEYAYARIPGAVLKPLGGIYQWAQTLDKDQAYVVYCHSGLRSWQAAMFLERLGFTRVCNLSGGLDAWSLHVDPTVPRY